MENRVGGLSGSREPSPSVSALTGFDPGREASATLGFIRAAVAEYREAPFRSDAWLAMQVMDALDGHGKNSTETTNGN